MPKPHNFQQTLWDIQKRFGDAVINPLSSLRSEREEIATGFAGVAGEGVSETVSGFSYAHKALRTGISASICC